MFKNTEKKNKLIKAILINEIDIAGKTKFCEISDNLKTVICSSLQKIYILNPANNSEKEINTGVTIKKISINKAGNLIAVLGFNNQILIVREDKIINRKKFNIHLNALELSKNSRVLLTGGVDRTIRALSLNFSPLWKYRESVNGSIPISARIFDIKCDTSAFNIACLAADSRVYLLQNKICTGFYDEPQHRFIKLAMSDCGEYVLMVSEDNCLTCIHTSMRGVFAISCKDKITALAVSRRFCVTGCESGKVLILNFEGKIIEQISLPHSIQYIKIDNLSSNLAVLDVIGNLKFFTLTEKSDMSADKTGSIFLETDLQQLTISENNFVTSTKHVELNELEQLDSIEKDYDSILEFIEEKAESPSIKLTPDILYFNLPFTPEFLDISGQGKIFVIGNESKFNLFVDNNLYLEKNAPQIKKLLLSKDGKNLFILTKNASAILNIPAKSITAKINKKLINCTADLKGEIYLLSLTDPYAIQCIDRNGNKFFEKETSAKALIATDAYGDTFCVGVQNKVYILDRNLNIIFKYDLPEPIIYLDYSLRGNFAVCKSENLMFILHETEFTELDFSPSLIKINPKTRNFAYVHNNELILADIKGNTLLSHPLEATPISIDFAKNFLVISYENKINLLFFNQDFIELNIDYKNLWIKPALAEFKLIGIYPEGYFIVENKKPRTQTFSDNSDFLELF